MIIILYINRAKYSGYLLNYCRKTSFSHAKSINYIKKKKNYTEHVEKSKKKKIKI